MQFKSAIVSILEESQILDSSEINLGKGNKISTYGRWGTGVVREKSYCLTYDDLKNPSKPEGLDPSQKGERRGRMRPSGGNHPRFDGVEKEAYTRTWRTTKRHSERRIRIMPLPRHVQR